MKKNYFTNLLIILLSSIKLSACINGSGASSFGNFNQNIYYKTPNFYDYTNQDLALGKVISNYPQNAYYVTVEPITFQNINRRTYMNIRFIISWDQGYLKKFHEIVTNIKNPAGKGWIKFVSRKHWSTPGQVIRLDQIISDKIMQELYRASPMLQVKVGNTSLGCFNIPALSGLTLGSRMAKNKMVQPNATGTIINSWLELASNITVEISPNYNIDNTKIFIVNSNQCS
ncbi:hypothetical protein OAR00_01085 [Alphaproteobacteria bacterium]|nr:hypothetical protein [Alphaproteobacteria bacterium]MDC1023128.1 hypothetical protein [Alphaproteobacteria bacterium]